MPRLRVSEKTLELNICAEVLQVIRQIPGCGGAFWIGMKQDQEARLGLDELIHNLPTGMHLALQFKAPRSEPREQIPYRFTINDRQNNNLLRLASNRPDAVYYVFPHYNTFTKMRSYSPDLLRDTYLMKVDDLRVLSASSNRLGTHKVETYPPIVVVESEIIELKLMYAYEIVKGMLSDRRDALEDILISHESLRKWLGELIDELQGNKRALGQRLRGFSTFCIS